MPMMQSEPDALARMYAASLFDLAKSAGGQEAIESTLGELDDLVELARSNPMFAEFLSSRIVPSAARSKSLDAILKGRVSELTLKFVQVLNQKDRLGHLAPIAAAFDQVVQTEFGRVEVDVYTASPISAEELGLIRTRLRAVLGKEPIVHPYTDPAMIGGVKLQIGDQLIDGSVATQLRRMRDQLTGEGMTALRAKADGMVQ